MSGFLKIAAAVPKVRPGDIKANAAEIGRLLNAARKQGAKVVLFPELSLAGATCGDIFAYDGFLDAVEDGISEVSVHTGGIFAVFGAPLRVGGVVCNCAVAAKDGHVAAVVPKNAAAQPFAAAREERITLPMSGEVPVASDILFRDDATGAVFGIAIGEDFADEAVKLAKAGANVILNPAAVPETAGCARSLENAIVAESARLGAAVVFAGAGFGESTTDQVFAGRAIIAENGEIIAKNEPFGVDGSIAAADVDVDFLAFERRRRGWKAPYADSVRIWEAGGGQPSAVSRVFPRLAFLPEETSAVPEYCREVFQIQTAALATRLAAIGAKDVALGISGGLDSALALLVCVEAFERLGLNRAGIHVYTMPGFGTTPRTKSNAHDLCEGLGLALETIDITPMVRRHFQDIGQDESIHDAAYENAQARARTMILMDKANQTGGIVIGTGDLSEVALGWCTYNGDHMSMYGVNAGVPKTVIREIVRHRAAALNEKAKAALLDILATPVSPELIPGAENGEILQKTEDKVGPYELHDYFLYHFIRRGKRKAAIGALAKASFKGVYRPEEVDKWLDVFFKRFCSQQFKRNCSPDGPQVLGVSLSPRGGWRMPSDMNWVIV